MTRDEAEGVALYYLEVAARLAEAEAAVLAGDRAAINEAMRLANLAMDAATELFMGAPPPKSQ